MRILLISSGSYYVMQKTVIPLGLLSIATHLKNNGHTVKIVDRSVENIRIKKILNSFQPDIVGISSLTFGSFNDALKVSGLIKEHNIPVVWGGQIPSLVPEIVLKEGCVDCVVMGDGEIAMLELLEAFFCGKPLSEIDGIAYIENGEIIINKQRKLADLAEFPIIDWTFVDPSIFYPECQLQKNTAYLLFQRMPRAVYILLQPMFLQRRMAVPSDGIYYQRNQISG